MYIYICSAPPPGPTFYKYIWPEQHSTTQSELHPFALRWPYIYIYICIYIYIYIYMYFPITAYSYASPLLKLLVLVDSAISDSVGAPQGGLPNGAPVGGTAVFQVPYVFYRGVELEGHMKKPVPRLWQVVFVMIFCTHIHIVEIEET